MKTCTKCKENKSKSEFVRDKRSKDGLYMICKVCSANYRKEMRKTKDGVTLKMYDGQKAHSIERGHSKPEYTLREFREWVYSKPEFHLLYDEWKKSGYKKSNKPSCDRRDDYKGYSFDNIRIVTWGDNFKKGCSDRANGINNKTSKAVLQFSKDGEFIAEFYSVSEAARQLFPDKKDNHISEVCKGKRKTTGGFIFKYKDEE